jgi:hypothetical protein
MAASTSWNVCVPVWLYSSILVESTRAILRPTTQGWEHWCCKFKKKVSNLAYFPMSYPDKVDILEFLNCKLHCNYPVRS